MSNHIDHIEITNFKSIRHQKIEGCKRINVFIGYPNVGKSNILEAISTLSFFQKDYYELFSKLCRIKGASELFYDGNYHDSACIKHSDKFKIEIKYLNEDTIDFSIKEFLREAENEGKLDTVFNTLKQIFFHKDDRLEPKQNSLIKDLIKVKKYHFKGVFNNTKTNGLSLFSPYGENLVDIVQSNKDLRKEVAELFKFYDLKLSIDQGNNSIKALKQLDDETIFLVPFYQMADTLQRLIFHKAAIMSNEDTVLLFEEPEAHMFPPYIRKFTEDIIFNKDNGNQYFISTHSPFVIDDLIEDVREDLSVYLVGLKNGETIIKKLSDEELEEVHKLHVDLFFNIASYLD